MKTPSIYSNNPVFTLSLTPSMVTYAPLHQHGASGYDRPWLQAKGASAPPIMAASPAVMEATLYL